MISAPQLSSINNVTNNEQNRLTIRCYFREDTRERSNLLELTPFHLAAFKRTGTREGLAGDSQVISWVAGRSKCLRIKKERMKKNQ